MCPQGRESRLAALKARGKRCFLGNFGTRVYRILLEGWFCDYPHMPEFDLLRELVNGTPLGARPDERAQPLRRLHGALPLRGAGGGRCPTRGAVYERRAPRGCGGGGGPGVKVAARPGGGAFDVCPRPAAP